MHAALDFLLFGWWRALRRKRVADPTVAGVQPPNKLYWSEQAHYLHDELTHYFRLGLLTGAAELARRADRSEITAADVAATAPRTTAAVLDMAKLYRERDTKTQPDQPTEKSCANTCKSGCTRRADRQKVSGP